MESGGPQLQKTRWKVDWVPHIFQKEAFSLFNSKAIIGHVYSYAERYISETGKLWFKCREPCIIREFIRWSIQSRFISVICGCVFATYLWGPSIHVRREDQSQKLILQTYLCAWESESLDIEHKGCSKGWLINRHTLDPLVNHAFYEDPFVLKDVARNISSILPDIYKRWVWGGCGCGCGWVWVRVGVGVFSFSTPTPTHTHPHPYPHGPRKGTKLCVNQTVGSLDFNSIDTKLHTQWF